MPNIRVSDEIYQRLLSLSVDKNYPSTLNGVISKLLGKKALISREVTRPAKKYEPTKEEIRGYKEKLGLPLPDYHYQRDAMRALRDVFGDDRKKLTRAYAWLEVEGKVKRRNNSYDIDPVSYAGALYDEGKRKGWLKSE